MQGEAGIAGMPGPKGVTVSYDKRAATFQQLTRLCAFFSLFFILSFFQGAAGDRGEKGTSGTRVSFIALRDALFDSDVFFLQTQPH